MASAISSLPVPVSPLITTVAPVGATTRTMPSTRRREALLPAMWGNPLPQSSLLSSATFADAASSISKHALAISLLLLSVSYSCRAHCFQVPFFLCLLWRRSRLLTTPNGRPHGWLDREIRCYDFRG